MGYTFKPVNATATVGLLITENGTGITGQQPTVELRRVSDGKYLDFSATEEPFWVSSGGQKTQILPPISWTAGLYEWEFDQDHYDQDAVEEYETIYRNDAPYELLATEILSFSKMGLTTTDITDITNNVWEKAITPLGVQAGAVMNILWAYAKGEMKLGSRNKVNVYNDDGAFLYSIELNPTHRTTSELEAGSLPEYGTAGRYQPNPNTDPELCAVFGVLRLPSGLPCINNDLEIYVEEKDLPQFAQHYLMSGRSIILSTDENGFFQANLIRKARVTMNIKQTKFVLEFQVPDVDEVSIEAIPGVYGIFKEDDNQF